MLLLLLWLLLLLRLVLGHAGLLGSHLLLLLRLLHLLLRHAGLLRAHLCLPEWVLCGVLLEILGVLLLLHVRLWLVALRLLLSRRLLRRAEEIFLLTVDGRRGLDDWLLLHVRWLRESLRLLPCHAKWIAALKGWWGLRLWCNWLCPWVAWCEDLRSRRSEEWISGLLRRQKLTLLLLLLWLLHLLLLLLLLLLGILLSVCRIDSLLLRHLLPTPRVRRLLLLLLPGIVLVLGLRLGVLLLNRHRLGNLQVLETLLDRLLRLLRRRLRQKDSNCQ